MMASEEVTLPFFLPAHLCCCNIDARPSVVFLCNRAPKKMRVWYVALGVLVCVWLAHVHAACTDAARPKRFITHALLGSPVEQQQQSIKTEHGCTMDDEYVMNLRDHQERYREWCCPPSNPNQRRAVQDGDEGEEDLPVSTQTFVPWNLDRLDQSFLPLNQQFNPPALLPLGSQTQIHVYMMDSGIDKDHRVFRDLDVRLSYAAPEYNTAADCNGHGTKTASIVAGYITGVVARGSDGVESVANIVLHAIRVVGCDGGGTTSAVIKGLTWIQNSGARPGIISMSIGSPRSTAMNFAIESIIDSGGFIVVAAAGNDGVDAGSTSPPSAAGVIGVGATDANDNRASYSNTGVFVDVFAPGNGVFGAEMNTYDYIIDDSGTSFSAPAFTGAVARQMLKTGNDNPFSAANDVLAVCTENVVKNAGYGSANRLLNTLAASTLPRPPPPPPPTPLPPPSQKSTGSHPQLAQSNGNLRSSLLMGVFLVLTLGLVLYRE